MIENNIYNNIDVNKYKNNKRNNNNIPIVLFIVMFTIGIIIMLYPNISNYINTNKQKKDIKEYTYKVETTNDNVKDELLEKADQYNSNLTSTSIQNVFSTDKVSKDEEYDNILNFNENGIMGYIEIPKININLPIYHGTTEDVLNKGVGHLKGSSLPVGGIGTHAILAAHRGLPSSKLFTDLDRLEVGDRFYIYVLGKKLVYEVDNVSVVKPNELSLLEIDQNQDYITLVTCTPYAVNTHRLLVRGKRVEEKEITTIENNSNNIYISNDNKLLCISLIIIIVTLIICVRKLKK